MEITKEEFEAYKAVRDSGMTNMFDMRNVTMMSGLTRDQCIDIMRNFGKYEDSFK